MIFQNQANINQISYNVNVFSELEYLQMDLLSKLSKRTEYAFKIKPIQ